MTAAERQSVAQFLTKLIADNGYRGVRLLDGDRYAALAGFMHTTAIIVGRIGDEYSIDERWCYHTPAAAVVAMAAWDGRGEPAGWFRAPMSGRRISESPDEYDDDDRRVGAVGVEYVRR